MIDHPSNHENNQPDTVADAKSHVFSATTNVVLFFLKAILVLNSGALVSMLLAISNSNDSAINNSLIEASVYFGVGLTAGVVGILFYSVEIHLDKEIRKYFKNPNKLGVLICGISILLSATIFLYGIWDIITNLGEVLALPPS